MVSGDRPTLGQLLDELGVSLEPLGLRDDQVISDAVVVLKLVAMDSGRESVGVVGNPSMGMVTRRGLIGALEDIEHDGWQDVGDEDGP